MTEAEAGRALPPGPGFSGERGCLRRATRRAMTKLVRWRSTGGISTAVEKEPRAAADDRGEREGGGRAADDGAAGNEEPADRTDTAGWEGERAGVTIGVGTEGE